MHSGARVASVSRMADQVAGDQRSIAEYLYTTGNC